METWKKEYLETCHTRHLLWMLNQTRKFNDWYSPWNNNQGFTKDEIKKILATREHIPNKKRLKLYDKRKLNKKGDVPHV